MPEPIFAERRFELGDETLPVRFFAPVETGGEYRCDWTIGWPGGEKSFHAYGPDAVAALLLAIRMVRANLVNSEAYGDGRLTYLGHRDLWLDLPAEAPDAGESRRTVDEIRYLNTDLDLFSAEDLTALAAALEERGMGIHHVGEHDGSWRAHLDMNDCYDTPALTIAAMLDVIETLPEPMKAVWTGCTHREFNMGFDCGSRPRPFEQALPSDLLARAAALGAGIGITLYPPTSVPA